ncbi:MAG: hypothetical protein A3I44_04720 [Candidatus Sungbacteria bacterium RIFCSPLOWO2_02_FULL_51_17]|uniref:Solute-binding protein family 5 domain-containing protein n=1 Tax=Candidatus Sungbacteria bacterium RIFCSPHIGHO2_02_FULL_51_29 TaxID=1802273 RepID=A0A1G2KWM2_9BACT|nr:MAG: hypothetical protein A2676_05275 [Candidatus Sungbacteria bacterium RIFCSPHIGHO2_01_FULL_51_22]OHA02871.1 MAG: hypothetical protein A3C16_01545 [Candidatus Sungbacteria bacterium RIFCSPHIGHO2_02_FULL_51_29]OHA05498.1 MAG: hypothetical protein A3B29_04385 [Candidatus Sungbacteria bacterium RIFCSPLOWO2_01_FULL_51_34]OHA11593.1 MAG: hypothetical protein A3I44_04720 [Candidatus Sungbacteria bacterium RIFCSPLOWO2_02_FULL_51_17]
MAPSFLTNTPIRLLNIIRRVLYLPRLFSRRELFLLIALLLVFLGSGSTLLGSFIMRHTVSAPKSGGAYREGSLREPKLINPIYLSNNDTDRDIAALIFSSMLFYDSEGVVQQDLAEAFSISDDGKVYTITLHKDAVWHDGEPLTAEDVLFTIKAIQNPEYKSPLRANFQGVTVEQTDDHTIEFTLKQPYSPFIDNLTVGILPKHIWEQIPPANTLSEFNIKPVGSGKYEFSKYKQSEGSITYYELVYNKKYYRQKPFIRTVAFSFYPDERELANAYKRGEIDAMRSVTRAQEDMLDPSPDLVLYRLDFPRMFAVFLNANKNTAFSDAKVRQALHSGIDRKKLLEILDEDARIIDVPLPSSIITADHVTETAFDEEAAKALLEKAGWKDYDANGFREKKEGIGKKETITPLAIHLVTSNLPELERVATFIKEYWGRLGAEVTVETWPLAELESQILRPRNYDALLFGEVYNHNPDPFAFWHSSQIRDPGLNIAMYSNRKADTLLEEARRSTDPELRKKKYEEFQKIVADDFGALFLWTPQYAYAARNTIYGINLKSVVFPSERFNEIETWYIKTRRAWVGNDAAE